MLRFQRENRKAPTRAEDEFWQAVRNSQLEGVRFLRQKAFDCYIVDFYCASAKLVIELDGAIHDTLEAIEYDTIRTLHLEARGLKVIRFRNEQVLNHLETVLEHLRIQIKQASKSPSSCLQERGA